jgi:hypothetical protein
MFLSKPLQLQYGRLVSHHIDVEVAQKGTQLLPEDGIVLPKHVEAIVKKGKHRIQCIFFVILYISRLHGIRIKNSLSTLLAIPPSATSPKEITSSRLLKMVRVQAILRKHSIENTATSFFIIITIIIIFIINFFTVANITE